MEYKSALLQLMVAVEAESLAELFKVKKIINISDKVKSELEVYVRSMQGLSRIRKLPDGRIAYIDEAPNAKIVQLCLFPEETACYYIPKGGSKQEAKCTIEKHGNITAVIIGNDVYAIWPDEMIISCKDANVFAYSTYQTGLFERMDHDQVRDVSEWLNDLPTVAYNGPIKYGLVYLLAVYAGKTTVTDLGSKMIIECSYGADPITYTVNKAKNECEIVSSKGMLVCDYDIEYYCDYASLIINGESVCIWPCDHVHTDN